MLNWRLTLEYFNANYIYFGGKKNVLADKFLRLPRIEGKSSAPNLELPQQDDQLYYLMEDSELYDCFVNFPPNLTIQNPLDLEWIQQHQFEDSQLNQLREHDTQRYPVSKLNVRPLICHAETIGID